MKSTRLSGTEALSFPILNKGADRPIRLALARSARGAIGGAGDRDGCRSGGAARWRRPADERGRAPRSRHGDAVDTGVHAMTGS